MKKMFLLGAMVCALGMSSYAQLGKPTTSVKDTFYIREVYYNGTKLNRADWPDTIIVEDALKVYVAKYVYVKGKLKKKLGGENYYDATCNGKTSTLTINSNYRYTIDDYVFIVKRNDKSYSQPEVNRNSLYAGRKYKSEDVTDNLEGNEQSHGAEGVPPESKVDYGYNSYLLSGRGSSVSYLLSGRSSVSSPAPQYNSNVQGKIVVKVWVDRSGNVVKVESPIAGSTISNAQLVKAAKESALKAKFSSDENAPEIQVGTITYVFITN